MNGKQIRMRRIAENGKLVIIPMDHGTSDGPISGLEDMNKIIPKIDSGGASAIVVHKGIIKSLHKPTRCGIIMHLSVSTNLASDPNDKVLVSTVKEAMILGADGVSIHVNIGGSNNEPEMIKIFGSISAECERLQMPLLAMIYPRGKNIKNKFDPDTVALIARIGGELGADIVKTIYTGDVKSFRKVVDGCPVPIVIAGGPKCSNDKEVLEMVKGTMDAGGMGVSLGRNVFQHRNPKLMVKALRGIIIEGFSVDEALKILGEAQ